MAEMKGAVHDNKAKTDFRAPCWNFGSTQVHLLGPLGLPGSMLPPPGLICSYLFYCLLFILLFVVVP